MATKSKRTSAGNGNNSQHLGFEARWHTNKAKAKSPEIGKVIDDAMGDVAQARTPNVTKI